MKIDGSVVDILMGIGRLLRPIIVDPKPILGKSKAVSTGIRVIKSVKR